MNRRVSRKLWITRVKTDGASKMAPEVRELPPTELWVQSQRIHGGRRKLTPSSCPLNSMWALWHMYTHRIYTVGLASTGKLVDSWGNVLLLTYHTPWFHHSIAAIKCQKAHQHDDTHSSSKSSLWGKVRFLSLCKKTSYAIALLP